MMLTINQAIVGSKEQPSICRGMDKASGVFMSTLNQPVKRRLITIKLIFRDDCVTIPSMVMPFRHIVILRVFLDYLLP